MNLSGAINFLCNLSFSILSATALIKLLLFTPRVLLVLQNFMAVFPHLPFHPVHYTEINYLTTQFLLYYSSSPKSMAPLPIQ